MSRHDRPTGRRGVEHHYRREYGIDPDPNGPSHGFIERESRRWDTKYYDRAFTVEGPGAMEIASAWQRGELEITPTQEFVDAMRAHFRAQIEETE